MTNRSAFCVPTSPFGWRRVPPARFPRSSFRPPATPPPGALLALVRRPLCPAPQLLLRSPDPPLALAVREEELLLFRPHPQRPRCSAPCCVPGFRCDACARPL